MLTPEIAAPKTEIEKARVLVVDDEYGPRESVAFTLATEFSVDTADRASEALKLLKSRSYEAVIMDIRMPEMDGIRALEELRKIDPDVSVIMLTGYGTLLTARQAMIGGANQYLRKPPDIDELISSVRKQTEASRLRRRQAKIVASAHELNEALSKEIKANEPQIWQGSRLRRTGPRPEQPPYGDRRLLDPGGGRGPRPEREGAGRHKEPDPVR